MRRVAAAIAAVLALAACPGALAAWSEPVLITPYAHQVQSLALVLAGPGDIEAVGTPQARIDGVAAYSSRDRGPFAVERLNGTPGDSPAITLDKSGAAIVLSYRLNTDLAIRTYTKPAGGRYGPARILDPRSAYPYDVITSPAGEVFALFTATNRQGTAGGPLRIAVRPAAGGRFGPVQRISAPARDIGGVELVFDGAGNALVAWNRVGGIQYALRPAGGSFGPPRALSTTSPTYSSFFDVESDATGRAAVVWRDRTAGRAEVRAAFGTVAGGFGDAQRIGGRASRGPELSLVSGGEAVAAWRGGDYTRDPTVTAAIARAERGFGPPRVIHRGYVSQLRVLGDRHGTATVGWVGTEELAAARHSTGTPGFAKQIVARRVRRFSMGATSDGRTILAWNGTAPGRRKEVRAAVARPRRSFGPPSTLARFGSREHLGLWPRIATGPAGSAFVLWEATRGPSESASYFSGSWLER